MYSELNIAEVMEALGITVGAPDEFLTPFLLGPPGVGKSSVVYQLSREIEMPLIEVRLSDKNPVDLYGMPYIPQDYAAIAKHINSVIRRLHEPHGTGSGYEPEFKTDEKKVRWAPPVFKPDTPSIIFFDEITLAPPAVQNAALQWILDKRCGEYEFPEGTVTIAAGNGLEHGVHAHKFGSNLDSRLEWITVKPDLEVWLDYAYQNSIHSNVIGYMNYKKEPALFHWDKNTRGAFPNPRSWEMVSNIMHHDNIPEKIRNAKIAGTIGEAEAHEFIGFTDQSTKMPDPEAILRGRRKIKVPEETDILYSLCGALVQALAKEPTQERMTNLLRYTSKMEKEFAILTGMDLKRVRPHSCHGGSGVGCSGCPEEVAEKCPSAMLLKNEEFVKNWAQTHKEVING